MNDYADLAHRVRSAGLLRRRHGYYAVKMAVNLLVFAGAWVGFVFIGDSWWQLFVAVVLAAVFGQLAFIGHDAGHGQIFRARRYNNMIGALHGGLVGMSYRNWVSVHNRHHANPNHEGEDPDIAIPALAFTTRQAGEKTGLLRWMAKYQAALFFPLLTLEGLNLHVTGVRAVILGENKARRLEGALLTAHAALYFAAVFLVLSPGIAVLFVVIHQALWGVYMGSSFAPNHKAMPIIPSGQRVDFLRKQVLTSRNVHGGRFNDFLLGGLNYQIEHHLFPNMPRPHLRRAQPIVQRFCAERDISYSQASLPDSYRQVLEHLHELGAPLRAAEAKPAL